MELNNNSILKIFETNFNYQIVDTPIGKAVKMPAYDAFLYANVTGAGYLENYVLPFSPKGMMKVFYNAFNYNFVTGIFENSYLRHSPYYLSLTRPFLFKGDKYILFKEFNLEDELREELKKDYATLIHNSLNPNDYIIHRVELSKKGNGMESFLEYIACETFKRDGYIVENQIPLAHTVGSPDFGGYALSETLSALKDSNFLNFGFHIIELSMIRIYNNKNEFLIKNHNDEAIVAEAKTSTTIMATQLEKYLNTKLFCEGYEMHPNKQKSTFDYLGILTFDKEYKVKVVKPSSNYNSSSTGLSKSEYLKWLNNYMKYYLIANLTNDELVQFVRDKSGISKIDISTIVDVVNNCSIREILSKVEEVCHVSGNV